MKKEILILLILITSLTFSQSIINYDDFFYEKALRIDYYHVGDINGQIIAMDEFIEEPYFAGSKNSLIDPFRYGNYLIELTDKKTNQLIYSKGFSTLFAEWLTTAEAKKLRKAFSETIVIPFPKNECELKYYTRNIKNEFELTDKFEIHPNSYFIKKDRRTIAPVIKILDNGDFHSCVDIAVIPEGYTKEETSKLADDVEDFVKNLFNSSPFKEYKNKFNVYLVKAFSEESGVDIPGKDIYKRTLVDAKFYTFDLERYLMTSDNKKLRDVASNAPYDQIYILVNTEKYGGGAIYNHYSVTVSNNKSREYITVHEFGHGFGGLADEYYTSDVAYEEFYKLDVEPWEPNITTLVSFDKKWKNMLDKDVTIPTIPDEKNKNKLGVYEGGGYVPKGVFRSRQDCTMKSLSTDNFCPVCKKALIDMIDYYTK